MINYNDAIEIIRKNFLNLNRKTEQVQLLDSLNRILAEDVISDISLPQFDNSAMDGIGVKFNKNISKWSVTGQIFAGNFKDITVSEENTVYITTGAKLPNGCDTVIPIEDIVFEENAAMLKDNSKVILGQHIRKCGEDLNAGTIVINKDTLLKSKHISIAAACGKSELQLYPKLKIGTLSTGDELVDISAVPTEDKIRCSNLYTILAAIKEINMEPLNLGFVNDNKLKIVDIIYNALKSDIDVLITTGGVSVGKYDHLKDVLRELGVRIEFSGVNIKPGKPMVFGVYEKEGKRKLIFGLPGNPVSALVNFIIFIKETILMRSDSNVNPFYAKLDTDIKKTDKKRHFIRGNCFIRESENYVFPSGSQSSANLYGMSRSNCLIVVEEERTNPKKGEVVKCMMI
jgi:molybdopterin molybdotransferase